MFVIKKLYEKYKQDVFGYLISLTHNPTLSEDLTSETFLSAIKSLPNFKGNSDIKTWLFSIARYKWYEHLRKEKHDIGLDDLTQLYIASTNDFESAMVCKEISDRILFLLEKESERVRNILKMRIEGYSFYEIAQKYDISENTARVIDFRAKKKIKEILEKEGLTYE